MELIPGTKSIVEAVQKITPITPKVPEVEELRKVEALEAKVRWEISESSWWNVWRQAVLRRKLRQVREYRLAAKQRAFHRAQEMASALHLDCFEVEYHHGAVTLGENGASAFLGIYDHREAEEAWKSLWRRMGWFRLRGWLREQWFWLSRWVKRTFRRKR